MSSPHDQPKPVRDLVRVYGEPSGAGFGSAVFWEPLADAVGLESLAREIYRRFVGRNWERFGEQAWMGAWRKVHARAQGATPDVVAELRGIQDPDAARSVPLLLEAVEDAEAGCAALQAAFDGEGVRQLVVFNVGDGGEMSGLLVASHDASADHALLVICLMD